MLQHPDETRNPKGTAIIAELGLEQYACYRGENFTQHQALVDLLHKRQGEIAMLYPAQGATVLNRGEPAASLVKVLIMIDATWSKAKRIWELNPQLHRLPCYQCPSDVDSNYRIRKAPAEGQLSTIESIVWALGELEGSKERFRPMLELFTQMIDFHIKIMGESTYQSNYGKKHDGKL